MGQVGRNCPQKHIRENAATEGTKTLLIPLFGERISKSQQSAFGQGIFLGEVSWGALDISLSEGANSHEKKESRGTDSIRGKVK